MYMSRSPNVTCYLFSLFCFLSIILAACASPTASPSGSNNHHSLSTNSGPITYSTSPNDVLVRTFRGGGNMGTLEISPEISIYGDGAYILGPGVYMQQGKLNSDELALLHIYTRAKDVCTITIYADFWADFQCTHIAAATKCADEDIVWARTVGDWTAVGRERMMIVATRRRSCRAGTGSQYYAQKAKQRKKVTGDIR